MPFVVVRSPLADMDMKNEVERLCKEAWMEMNGTDNVSGLEAQQVGLVAANTRRGIEFYHEEFPSVEFYYVKRGVKFYEALINKLQEKLAKSIKWNYCLLLIETEEAMWADPEWSVRECTRPHSDDAYLSI